MPRNYYKPEYYYNPDIQKPLEEIYADLDLFTSESFPDEDDRQERMDFMVAVPPLHYGGTFLRGLFISQGVDIITEQIPDIKDYFIPVAFSMTSAYPWSKTAEGYLTSYKNPHRDNWFRATYPDRADKYLIPLEDGDYLHEYDFPPKPFPEKDIDLFCVSRLIDLKNIPFIAKALKVYRQKYPQKPVRLTLITGREFDQNFQGILPYEVREWRQVESILIHPQDYIELIPRVDWYRTLPLMYARAKVYLFGSLIEGKNRSMAEALCCNTPILYNIEFNQYIRGETPIVPEGAGLGAFYDPESWADTLHLMLNNLGEFTPRKQFLKYRGRKNFLNTAIDSVSYYRQHLPNYQEGKHHQNTWLDTAVGYHYNLSLMEFLYGKRHGISQVRGITQIRQAMEVYRAAVGKR